MIPVHVEAGKSTKNAVFYNKHRINLFRGQIMMVSILLAPGSPPSPEQLKKMTKEYQKQIRNSPLWDEMVQKYGKKEAEKLLKEFKAEVR